MRFTLRDLLAFMFIVALVALSWNAYRAQQVVHASRIQAEVDLAERTVALAELRRATGRASQQIDWYVARAEVAQRAIEHFAILQEKYGVLTAGGADQIVLRMLPSLPTEAFPDDHWCVRVVVPSAHRMFLKFGVAHDVGLWESVEDDSWLRESGFDLTGPYEVELTAGQHDIAVTSRKTGKEKWQQFHVTLDSQPLLLTTFQRANVSGASGEWASASDQREVAVEGPCPLRQTHVRQGDMPPTTFRLWLEATASHFEVFPANGSTSIGLGGAKNDD